MILCDEIDLKVSEQFYLWKVLEYRTELCNMHLAMCRTNMDYRY